MKRLLYFILMGVNYRRKEHPERAKAPFRCSFVCCQFLGKCCAAAGKTALPVVIASKRSAQNKKSPRLKPRASPGRNPPPVRHGWPSNRHRSTNSASASLLALCNARRARDPEMSDMHSHLRAQRCMEKRLLRDLWRAWRRAKVIVAERPMEHVPAASNRKDAA
jgi:hypothetical protein